MEVVYQEPNSSLEDFEILLLDHPWDEAYDDKERTRSSSTSDIQVTVTEQTTTSTHHDPSTTFIVKTILDNGTSIPISKGYVDEQVSDSTMIHHQQDEECIEISPMVRTNLFTIFEEETSCGSDDSTIQCVRQVPFHETRKPRSETCPEISSRTRHTTPNIGKRKRKRLPGLKKARQKLWVGRKSTRDEARNSSQDNGHSMPFYSVRSILKDLEALSVLSETTSVKNEVARTDSKDKYSRCKFKKGRIRTPKWNESEDGLSTAQTRVTRNPYRIPFVDQSSSPSDVSGNVTEESEDTPPSRCNPIRALCRGRARMTRAERKNGRFESNDPSLIEIRNECVGKTDNSLTTEAERLVKRIFAGDIGIEKNDRPTSIGSTRVTSKPILVSRTNTDDSRDPVQTEYIEKKFPSYSFQPYSYGVDMMALLTDTLMDMSHLIGGKLDHTCCAGQEGDKRRREGSSLILVGSSESVGELTLTSHEVHINQLEANDEAKHGD